MKKAKVILIPTISLFIICMVATALLALTNKVTLPKIEEINMEIAAESRKQVLPEATSFEKKNADGVGEYYIGLDKDKNIVGYVFTCPGTNKGYGGVVEVMTGIDKEGKVTGVNPITLNETPGLGMNAAKDTFKNQFKGKSGELEVIKSAPKDNQIQALTSATVTSRAFTSSVNAALENYEKIGGQN
ncbi:MAG: RnfABCDGE type electron transport complex subunit G [Clostridia bacterium]|nr:RnfABCDGE type electron transport complex subunit G [Clostridia bacterium]